MPPFHQLRILFAFVDVTMQQSKVNIRNSLKLERRQDNRETNHWQVQGTKIYYLWKVVTLSYWLFK